MADGLDNPKRIMIDYAALKEPKGFIKVAHVLDPSKDFVSFTMMREDRYRLDEYVKSIGTSRSVWLNKLVVAQLDRLGVCVSKEILEKAKAVLDEKIAFRNRCYTRGKTYADYKKIDTSGKNKKRDKKAVVSKKKS